MSWNKNTFNSSRTSTVLDLDKGAKVLESVELPGYGLNDGPDQTYILRKVKASNGKIYVDHFSRCLKTTSGKVIRTKNDNEERINHWSCFVLYS